MNPSDLSPEQQLAAAFGQQVVRWATALGADAATAEAAGMAGEAVSLASANGHVCVHLASLANGVNSVNGSNLRDAAAWRAVLIASGTTLALSDAPARGAQPLVLDPQDRLYLHRYFDYEQRLAKRLLQAQASVTEAPNAERDAQWQQRLSDLFDDPRNPTSGPINWQKLAAALALRGRLLIVSGGPGTGKTTTVVNLLACLLADQPDCRIALAAPTGKAAARMLEAVRQQAQRLPEALRNALPQQSFTVHRLLQMRAQGGFRYNANQALPIDALVLDEASMLDLALATHLFEAVPDHARIILLGDRNQLSAVESGSVFAEIGGDPSLSSNCRAQLAHWCGVPAQAIQPPQPSAASTLQDSVVWFTQNYRFAADSGIGQLAARINSGDAGAVLQNLHNPSDTSDPSVQWLIDAGEDPHEAPQEDPSESPSQTALEAILAHMQDAYAPMFQALRAVLKTPGIDPDAGAISKAFARFRVLCALRETSRGVVSLNHAFSASWRAALGPQFNTSNGPWYPGRPVQILRNDYTLRLFNGDVGIALPDAHGQLQVYFAQADAATGFRAIAPLRLPAHETAFAMTVHKSQGSEFDAVLVVLPAQRSRVLTRELLYTAVTRARQKVALCTSAAVLSIAVQSTLQRHSGLLDRLREVRL